jgi:hypothetical protein
MIPKRDDAYLMAMRHKTKTGNRSSSVERTEVEFTKKKNP